MVVGNSLTPIVSIVSLITVRDVLVFIGHPFIKSSLCAKVAALVVHGPEMKKVKNNCFTFDARYNMHIWLANIDLAKQVAAFLLQRLQFE